MKYEFENHELEQAEIEIGYVPFTQSEYIQALTKFSHPRHKEAMIIRASKHLEAHPSYQMTEQQEQGLINHYTPNYINE